MYKIKVDRSNKYLNGLYKVQFWPKADSLNKRLNV